MEPPREVPAAGDAVTLQALEAFYGVDPESPHVREWTPFLTALSRNALMRRIVADAAARSSPSNTTVETTRSDANGAVIEIVAEGLRRVDDADLLAARPLVAKMFFGMLDGCREAGPDGTPQQPRIQVEDELAGLQPVLTRAVVAINAGMPVVAIDEVELVASNERASALVLADDFDAGRECERAATLIRSRLQGPVAEAPLVTRALLGGYVESRRRPHAYAAGDAPAYPPEALRASIVGSQVVRFTVDATGRIEDVKFVSSDFTPSTITRPDGTLVVASSLFDAEIRAWLVATSGATPARYPAKERNGVLASPTYEIPFDWQIDGAQQKGR